MKKYLKNLYNTTKLLLIITIICGLIYPMSLALVGNILAPKSVNGQTIYQNNKIIGIKNQGQTFNEKKYLLGRISTSQNIEEYKEILSYENKNIPIELISYTASNKEPFITYESALFQVKRLAKINKISDNKIIDIINNNKISNPLSLNKKDLVNVLLVNIELNKLIEGSE